MSHSKNSSGDHGPAERFSTAHRCLELHLFALQLIAFVGKSAVVLLLHLQNIVSLNNSESGTESPSMTRRYNFSLFQLKSTRDDSVFAVAHLRFAFQSHLYFVGSQHREPRVGNSFAIYGQKTLLTLYRPRCLRRTLEFSLLGCVGRSYYFSERVLVCSSGGSSLANTACPNFHSFPHTSTDAPFVCSQAFRRTCLLVEARSQQLDFSSESTLYAKQLHSRWKDQLRTGKNYSGNKLERLSSTP